jgi:diguanylate cyclase (GGDEF)-like protein
MRLVSRTDTSLAIALIVGTFIVFQRPLRWALELTREVEARYHLDLLPALTVLTVVFVFHQYRKRQEARAEVLLVAAQATQARARSEELERLMIFGQALGNSFDRAALHQVLCRMLPAFVGERGCWVLTRRDRRWEPLLQEVLDPERRPLDALEAVAATVASSDATAHPRRDGLLVGTDVCFPMVAGGTSVGVLGIRNSPPLGSREREAVGAAAALLAIGVRNVQLLQETREHSVRDGLTGCFNRAFALETLDKELRRARRSSRPLSLLMFDLDHFKRVNDTGGHLQGDAVLAAVGAQLHHLLRGTDFRCRYGGDEFLLILPDTPLLGAQQVAEGLRREIAGLQIDGAPAGVTASIGVALAAAGEMEAAGFVARADQALYEAKRAGKNRFCVAAPAKGLAVARTSGLTAIAG